MSKLLDNHRFQPFQWGGFECLRTALRADIFLPIGACIDNLSSKTCDVVVFSDDGTMDWVMQAFPRDSSVLASWISDAERDYLRISGENAIIERMYDEPWIGDRPWKKADMIREYREKGISSTLLLYSVILFEQRELLFAKFTTGIDSYLWDYDFCLMRNKGAVSFLTADAVEGGVRAQFGLR